MMMHERICLSGATRAQLSSLYCDLPVHFVIMHEDVAVGVCTTEKVPSQVVLPAGLSWQSCSGVTVGDLIAAPSAEALPPFVTLRLQSHIQSLERSKISRAEQAAKLIDSASIITINDLPLAESSHLSEIIPDSQSYPSSSYQVALYTSADQSELEGDQLPNSPYFTQISVTEVEVWQIDVIAHVKPDAGLNDICGALKQAIERFMCAATALVESNLPESKHNFTSVRARHFDIFGGHLGLTVITLDVQKELEEGSVNTRRALHEALALPQNQPLLRDACSTFAVRTIQSACGHCSTVDLVYDGGYPGRLRNVHVGLKPPHGSMSQSGSADEVSVHMVRGDYLYCHYLQDHIDDDRWGCAYRAAQTLLSWCVLQRMALFPPDNDLPKHSDMQRALVAVGDKPSEFVGKREWIGANEVCYVLDELAGVHSKIVHVSSGTDVAAERGRELAAHFDEQGSPVMIGGGVLAWTLLGIARNNVSGQCKFLILDPHYKGRDDLQTIQNKGWVGWKSDDIFDASAFYNLCLPQRPSTV